MPRWPGSGVEWRRRSFARFGLFGPRTKDKHVTTENKPQLLSPSDTARRCAMSWRTIQRQVRAGTFPKPLRISANRIAFLESEVAGWIADRPRCAEAA